MLVDIVVYDGLDEMDALGPMEVMRSAGKAGAALSVRLVTRTPQSLVTGAYGLRFVPDGTFVPGEANIIVVTGGGWVARADCGAWGEVQRGDWLPLLADAAKCARSSLASVRGRCCSHTPESSEADGLQHITRRGMTYRRRGRRW